MADSAKSGRQCDDGPQCAHPPRLGRPSECNFHDDPASRLPCLPQDPDQVIPAFTPKHHRSWRGTAAVARSSNAPASPGTRHPFRVSRVRRKSMHAQNQRSPRVRCDSQQPTAGIQFGGESPWSSSTGVRTAISPVVRTLTSGDAERQWMRVGRSRSGSRARSWKCPTVGG
jgi:hypothetical protein